MNNIVAKRSQFEKYIKVIKDHWQIFSVVGFVSLFVFEAGFLYALNISFDEMFITDLSTIILTVFRVLTIVLFLFAIDWIVKKNLIYWVIFGA